MGVRTNGMVAVRRFRRRAGARGVPVGGDRRSGRKPDQGNGVRGGNRRSVRETAVGEFRKETADRVARHQADQ